MALGTYEPHVSAAFRQELRPGDCVIDIGAHVGYLTLLASRCVGPSGQVVAIEASSRNARLLRENVARNNAGNVTVMECAISDEVGTVTFASFDTYSSVGHIQSGDEPDDATLESVPSATIDHLVTQNAVHEPKLIKIDVEGAEFQVIQGAVQVLESCSPTVIVEVRRGTTMESVTSLMNSMRYMGVELRSTGGMADDGVIDMAFTKRHAAS